jgi:hypothetical protein
MSSPTSGQNSHKHKGGPGLRGRRRSGRRGARTRLGTGRGRRGELEDVLTGVGVGGMRPDFEGAAPAVRPPGGGGALAARWRDAGSGRG